MMKETGAKTNYFTILMAVDDPAERLIGEQAFLELGKVGRYISWKTGKN